MWSEASWPRAMQIAQEFFESRQPDALYDKTAHQRWLRESMATQRWRQAPTRKVTGPAAGRQMGGSRESTTQATSQTGGDQMYPYPRRCYVCQRYGHISTDCPERSDDQQRKAGERQRGSHPGHGGTPPGRPYKPGSSSNSTSGPVGREIRDNGSGREQWQGASGKPWATTMPRSNSNTSMAGPVGREGEGSGKGPWQGPPGVRKVGVLMMTERSEGGKAQDTGKSSYHDRAYHEREEEHLPTHAATSP